MANLLTHDLWKLVLKHVPQGDRLQRCALVCSAMRRAAAEATDVVCVESWKHDPTTQQQQEQADALLAYLQHYGGFVTSIKLWGDVLPQVLPCPNLIKP